jgi:hypothetical protein
MKRTLSEAHVLQSVKDAIPVHSFRGNYKPKDFYPYENQSTLWLHGLFMLAPNLSFQWKTWLMDLISHELFDAQSIR